MKVKNSASQKSEAYRFYTAILCFIAALTLFLWSAYTPSQVRASSDNQPPLEISFQAVKNTGPILIYGTTVNSTFTIAKIFKGGGVGNSKAQWETETLNQITPFNETELKVSNMMAGMCQ